MVPLKLLLRTASCLQQVWQARAANGLQSGQAGLERLAARQRALRRAQEVRDKARAHGFSHVAPQLHTNVLRLVSAVQTAALEARASLEQPAPLVPSLSFLLAELRQVEAEFEALRIDGKERFLAATTEAITLERVDLGPFAIRFFWERLHHHPDEQCFDIVALDPHPAATNDRVTHPHVRSQKLCAGDARAALRQALLEGRLADAYCLNRSVLRHYNRHSPHVPMAEWVGTECHDCGRSVDEEDRSSCEACDHDFCVDCSSSCAACGNRRCHGCLTCCAVCGEDCCRRCFRSSAHSRRECCRSCMRTCASCGAPVGKDELCPETDRCPSCVSPEQRPVGEDTALSPGSGSSLDSPSEEPDHATTLERVAPAPA
jgi:hypothetical protein